MKIKNFFCQENIIISYDLSVNIYYDRGLYLKSLSQVVVLWNGNYFIYYKSGILKIAIFAT